MSAGPVCTRDLVTSLKHVLGGPGEVLSHGGNPWQNLTDLSFEKCSLSACLLVHVKGKGQCYF